MLLYVLTIFKYSLVPLDFEEFVVEEFVAVVFTGGKVTVPKQLRERFGIDDGDYVRLALVEVLKKGENGEWVRRKVSNE